MATLSGRTNHFSNGNAVEIAIAPNAGACFGVVRAIKLGRKAAQKAKTSAVYSLGHLIHNPKVVQELETNGVKTVDNIERVEGGTVILRSHGIKRQDEEQLRARNINVVDATCPLVKKPQRIAQGFGQKGYFLVVVGDANHPEVKGVLSYFGSNDSLVCYNAKDIDKIPTHIRKVGVLAQTTIELRVFNAIVERCKERFEETVVSNTICDATSIRQTEAEQLATQADVMIVVGGRNSSNTNKLVKICKSFDCETHLIEELEEIDMVWFQGKTKIGVTGGASTPMDFVDRVGEHIAGLLVT